VKIGVVVSEISLLQAIVKKRKKVTEAKHVNHLLMVL